MAGQRLLLSVIRDITDRKEADQALRDSEARFRDLFENANDVIYTLDLEGRLTSLNKRGEQTFGYPLAECLDRPVGELDPARVPRADVRGAAAKLAGEAPTTYELEVVTRDGCGSRWR